MSVMIEAKNLGRYFGEIKAVDGVSFAACKGDVLGFLGPNGAGKSTTMKMLTCFLTPTFGSARVGGFDVTTQSRQVREVLGYLPENAPLYGDMEVVSFLRFVSDVRGMPVSARESAIDRVVKLASLAGVANQRIETLSKGFKRRVGLAQALIHDPQILILDEPTDGLDPNQKHEVRELIRSMSKDKCILLSTHILEEVEEVCNRVVIIAKGKIVVDETPEQFRKRSPHDGAVTITFTPPGPENIESQLRKLPGVKKLEKGESSPNHVAFTLLSKDSKQLVVALVREAEQSRWNFIDLRIESGKLDEVFREVTM